MAARPSRPAPSCATSPSRPTLTGPRTALLEYATYPEGLRARSVTGRIEVTINPLPDPVKRPNQAADGAQLLGERHGR